MATRQIDIKDYCDSLYKELYGVKSRLSEFVTMIEHMEDKNKKILNPYIRHLRETLGFIDWKMEIFSKVCPIDWSKFIQDIESTVSVPPVETREESKQPAGGFVGG